MLMINKNEFELFVEQIETVFQMIEKTMGQSYYPIAVNEMFNKELDDFVIVLFDKNAKKMEYEYFDQQFKNTENLASILNQYYSLGYQLIGGYIVNDGG